MKKMHRLLCLGILSSNNKLCRMEDNDTEIAEVDSVNDATLFQLSGRDVIQNLCEEVNKEKAGKTDVKVKPVIVDTILYDLPEAIESEEFHILRQTLAKETMRADAMKAKLEAAQHTLLAMDKKNEETRGY